MSDSWLTEYESCAQMGQDIMEKINERNKHARTSSAYTKLSANSRSYIKQFSSSLSNLKQGLLRASSSYHIHCRTQREVERRQRMLDILSTKEKQIEQAFRNEGTDSSKYALMGSGVDSFSSHDPWGVREESMEYQGRTDADIRQQQQQVIEEQDRGLEALSHVITNQKNMAIDIGNEVVTHNEILDDINDHVDRTGQRLIKETRHIKIVDRKSATCWYWVVIILLFVAIVVIAVVPYHGKK